MAAIRPINLEDLRTVFAEVLDKGHDCKQEGVIATLVEQQRQTAIILAEVTLALNGTVTVPGLKGIAGQNQRDISGLKGSLGKILWVVVTPSVGLVIGALFYLVLSHGIVK
jgi:hypothetical protein